jgi:hypothetical protein
VVGRSYPPEFYSFIENKKLRNYFERIAIETEEDYQGLINKLHEFGIETVRPNVPDILPNEYYKKGLRIPAPVSMNPRDLMIMLGKEFYLFPYDYIAPKVQGRAELSDNELAKLTLDTTNLIDWWKPIYDKLKLQPSVDIHDHITNKNELSSALRHIKVNGITRIGRDLYFGTKTSVSDIAGNPYMIASKILTEKYLKENYRYHFVDTGGHIDGCFTPVKPGLIISADNMDSYKETFPNWEIVTVTPTEINFNGWNELKRKNNGSWWIPGAMSDDDLINFVETWLKDWVGLVDETYFDVNSLVIDEKNILVSGYNKQTFDAYERHGITPHIVSMRHHWFWDGGLSCVTAELHREGVMTDWFSERAKNEYL